MTTTGGMYELLRIILKIVIDTHDKNFNKRKLCKHIDLCDQSITANLTRLVKIGFLERIETNAAPSTGERIYYKLKEEAYIFALKQLYEIKK